LVTKLFELDFGLPFFSSFACSLEASSVLLSTGFSYVAIYLWTLSFSSVSSFKSAVFSAKL